MSAWPDKGRVTGPFGTRPGVKAVCQVCGFRVALSKAGVLYRHDRIVVAGWIDDKVKGHAVRWRDLERLECEGSRTDQFARPA